MYLEIDYACAILEFDLLAGLVRDELIVLFDLLFLLLFFRGTALKPILLLGLLILLEGCGRAELLDLLLPGGDVADTRLRSKRTILLFRGHRWLGLSGWLWLRARVTSFEAWLASGA